MISVVHDLALRQTTLASADLAATVERSRAERIQISLTESFASAPLGADAELLFTLKEKGKRNGPALVQLALTIAELKENALSIYVLDFDAITAAVNTLLGVSDGDDNTITAKQCEGCLSYRETGSDEWQDGDPFEVLLINCLRTEDDETPAAIASDNVTFRPLITGLTGGGATKLDGIVTAGITVPRVVVLVIPGEAILWILQAGTTAEASPSVIRPDDYAASTNEKIWTPIL